MTVLPDKTLFGIGEEDETARDGPLSSFREWHALLAGLMVGAIAALAGGLDGGSILVTFAAVAFGVRHVKVGHLKHIRTEPVYALVGAVVSFLVTAYIIVPRLPTVGLLY